MWISSWWRNPKRSGVGERRHTRGAPRQRSTFRPHLEALEDRWVPSTLKHTNILVVTNTLDNGLNSNYLIPGSLRYEIAQAQSNDTIVFDFGKKSADAPHTIMLAGEELKIGKNLTIQGPGAGLLTVASPGRGNYNASRIFEVDGAASSVALSGMTISNGNSAEYYNSDPVFGTPYYDGLGGGILNFGTLTISGCILSGNFASGGAYIYGYGAGGAIANFGTLTMSACTLSNNYTGADGGGIYNAGTMTLSGSTLSGNTAGAPYGGGIYNDYGATLTINGCSLTGNAAWFGGGAISNAGSLTVSNSVFSGNTPDNIFGPFIDGGGNSFN
jgi:hypothetical protein